jgi:hypothetical protein
MLNKSAKHEGWAVMPTGRPALQPHPPRIDHANPQPSAATCRSAARSRHWTIGPSPSAGLAVTARRPPSRIACRGPSTRGPVARPRTELAGAARPVRRDQGRRDPGAPSRGRRTTPTQPTPDNVLGRPCVPQRTRQTASYLIAQAAACVAEDSTALARPSRRPRMDLPATPTRPPTRSAADPGTGAADGP